MQLLAKAAPLAPTERRSHASAVVSQLQAGAAGYVRITHVHAAAAAASSGALFLFAHPFSTTVDHDIAQ